MKAFKVVGLSILSVFAIIYLAFLFVLPYSIDLNQYSSQITKIVQDNTGFLVDVDGLKVKTAWNLSAGALINKTDLKYPTGGKFAQINNLQIRLSLLPLFLGKVQVDKIDADKVFFNVDVDKKGEFLLKQYLSKNSPLKNKHINIFNSFALSDNMPEINVKKYRVSFINGQNKYSFKGKTLKISDFVLNKKIKIKSGGVLILNERKQISYDVSIFSKVFPKNKGQNNDVIKIFEDLYRYNINADIKADLSIKEKKNDSDIDGKINIDNILFTFGGRVYPQSNLKMIFKGDKAKINASLHVNKNSKAIITGLFKTGKHRYIDLQVLSDKVNIRDILLIAKAMSRPLGIKNLQNYNADGFLKADFNIRSDFKKVESRGYLKLNNASIINKLYNVALTSINADIDFSQDYVQINKAYAKLNSQPITIKGNIDKNANANISVLANDLQLKSVLLAVGRDEILKENDILNGLVNLNATLKGRLDKASPKVNVIVSGVNLKNNNTKTQIKFTKAVINTSNYSTNSGKVQVTALKITPNKADLISIPNISLNFDEKNLNIEKTYLYIDNIRTILTGQISDIMSRPKIDSLNISIPNQISVPITGYKGSNAIIKGNLAVSGDLYSPRISGQFDLPFVRIPTMSIVLKNTTLQFGKIVKLSCPYMQMANSLANFNAQIDDDFSKGIVVQNINFSADNINLNALPLLKFNNQNSSSITILKGKSSVRTFKVADIVSNNITSDIALKNNILYLNNLRSGAYFGKIGGNVNYDFIHRKAKLELQGRGLNARTALIGLLGRDDDINGTLDFDSNVSFVGYSQGEILRSLKGYNNFIISNGKMGLLGKFEHLIYAQNIISNNVFKTTLNLIAKAITVKNTGVYKYMKGKLIFSNGWANIIWIKTSGPSMSLYITGRYYMPENTVYLIMLGRISDDVVRILGPIGEFSMNKAISSIPQLGAISSYFASQFTTNPNYENISMIPYLTPRTEFPTKEFKVIIDGDVQKQSSVKVFKWLANPKIVQTQTQQSSSSQKQAPAVPDFVKKLPDFKK